MQATEEYIKILTTGLSTETGLKIQEGKEWRVDAHKRTLEYPLDDLRNLPFDVVRGLLLHEIGHILFSIPLKKGQLADKYGHEVMQNIYNYCEDIRIESELFRKYGFFSQEAIASSNFYILRSIFNRTKGNWLIAPEYLQFLQLLRLMDYTNTSRDIANILGHNAGYLWVDNGNNIYNPGVQISRKVTTIFNNRIDSIKSVIYDLRDCHDGSIMQEIADKQLFPIIKELLEDNQRQEKSPSQQPQSAGSISGGSNANGSDNGQNDQQDNQSHGSQHEKQNDPKKENKDQKDSKGNNADNKADDKNNQKKQQDNKNNNKPEKEENNNQKFDKSVFDGCNIKGGVEEAKKDRDESILGKINASGMLGGKGMSIKKRSFARPKEPEAKALLKPWTSVLANRLRDILIEKKAVRWTGAHKSGKLLGKNTFKVLVSDESRIFSRKNNPDTPDYKVFLALDSSGSMGVDKAYHTFMGAVLLKSVSEILNFDMNIYSYDTTASLLTNLEKYNGSGGGTNDLSALEVIDKDMRPGNNNLIIFITDGEPDSSRYGEFERLWHKMKKEKSAELIGIGIGRGIHEESLKRCYENAIHVPDAKDLPIELVKLMRGIIHR